MFLIARHLDAAQAAKPEDEEGHRWEEGLEARRAVERRARRQTIGQDKRADPNVHLEGEKK